MTCFVVMCPVFSVDVVLQFHGSCLGKEEHFCAVLRESKFLIKSSVLQKYLSFVKKLKALWAIEVFLTAFEQQECSKDGGLFLSLIFNSAWVSQALMQP